MKKILNAIKNFILGILTGFFTGIMISIITLLKIKGLFKRRKNEKNKNLFTHNKKSLIKGDNTTEWRQVRQPNRIVRKEQSNLDRGLQCRQFEQPRQRQREGRDTESRNSGRKLLRDSGNAQREIQSDTITKPETESAKLGSDDGKDKNIADKRNKQKMER